MRLLRNGPIHAQYCSLLIHLNFESGEMHLIYEHTILIRVDASSDLQIQQQQKNIYFFLWVYSAVFFFSRVEITCVN
jgi:hypothetical protein